MGGRAPGSREGWFLIRHKKCFVLLCPIGEQHLLSSFREFVHDGYYLATVARFVHQAFLTRNEGTTADESTNVSNAISRSNLICTEKIVSYGSQCIVNNRKFKMKWRRESKKSNSLTRQNNNFASASCFLCCHCTTTTWKCLISRFVKDVDKQWQNLLSLYELGYDW